MDAIYNPLVSIIIPVYNTSKYIDKCLSSIISQTYNNLEVICVNDLSTDDSLQKLNYWASKDQRIQVVNHIMNLKAGGARNTGVKCAKGEFLAFIDSDDYISAEHIKRLVEHSYEMDVITNRIYAECDEEGGMLCIISTFPEAADSKTNILANGAPRIWNSIFRRTFIVNNMLHYPENCFFEDNAIALCMFLLSDNIRLIDNEYPTYFYRQNLASQVHTISPQKINDRLQVAELMLANTKKYGLFDRYKNKVLKAFFNLYFRGTMFSLISFRDVPEKRKYARLIYNGYLDNVGSFPDSPNSIKEKFWFHLLKLVGKYPILIGIARLIYVLNQARIKYF